MQRYLVVLALCILGTVALVAENSAAEPHISIPQSRAGSGQMVRGIYRSPSRTAVTLTPINSRLANDSCTLQSNLPRFSQTPSGFLSSDVTVVNGFTIDDSDPELNSCTFSEMPNDSGYRTAWYTFVAPATGRMSIDILPNFNAANNYDTVLAVYSGASCETLSRLVCNDDAVGLLSRVTTDVVQGHTYFIEVADYNLQIDGAAQLQIQIFIESSNQWVTDSDWNIVTESEQPRAARSRHDIAVVGDELFVFGGQIVVDNTVPNRTADVAKFDTSDGEWTQLAPFPSFCGNTNAGYSNTDGAYLRYSDGVNTFRRVFFPSGYVGDNGIYVGTHCVYDIDRNSWSTAAPAPWSVAPPAYTLSIPRPNSGGYFVIGGLVGPFFGTDSQSTVVTDVLFYLAQGNSNFWDDVLPPLPDGRYAHTGILIEDRFLCIAGGLRPGTTSTTLLTDALCLDFIFASNGWQPIAAPNIPRFNASSGVGPDGHWYIWGGVTAITTSSGGVELAAVADIEVYDRNNNRWLVLDDRFDLDRPARSWAHGGFVGDTLWVIGGETEINSAAEGLVVPEVKALAGLPQPLHFVGPNMTERQYLPFLWDERVLESLEAQASALPFDVLVRSEFNNSVFDVWTFFVGDRDTIELTLASIPQQNNYDLYLYDGNKILLADSRRIGNLSETIVREDAFGRFYVIVVAETINPLENSTYSIRMRRK